MNTKYLGNKAVDFDGFDLIEINMSVDEVCFETDEIFTLCPVTSQPDFNSVKIIYTPKGFSIESKSLKLYFRSITEDSIFGENLAAKIADDIYKALRCPVQVVLTQGIRGGIQMSARATRGFADGQ